MERNPFMLNSPTISDSPVIPSPTDARSPLQITSLHRDMLFMSLTKLFGNFDQALLNRIEPLLEWVHIGGGECLFNQHEPGDCLYFVISGRLQATIKTPDGKAKKIGEIMRGETVGEMALFTGDPRSATITAIRDSVLVKLSKPVFEQVIMNYPVVAINVTKLIINRLNQAQAPRKPIKKPVNICLMAAHPGVDIGQIADDLFAQLQRKGTAKLLSSERINAEHGQADLAQIDRTDMGAYLQLTKWLEEQESQHEFMIFVADESTRNGTLTPWSHRCLRQADEIMVFVDATQKPTLTPIEQHVRQAGFANESAQTLILVHPIQTAIPQHTAQWLNHRTTVRAHYHIRAGSEADIARLGRILSGTAIGFVLAGGGAKGFAHVGVLKALQEFGIPVDFVGGTSVGGLVAGAISFGQPADIVSQHMRKGAFFNPTGDYNWFPLISLIRGGRIEQMIRNCVKDFSGYEETDIEDSWLTLFTLSSNYTQAREEVHMRGSLVKFMRSTTAIPGVFPPVIHGNDFLVDGGTFNNFPADVMSRLPVGKIIGVDFVIDKQHEMTIEDIPSPRQLMRDKLRNRKNKKYRLPSLVSIMLNSTLLYSTARRNETLRYLDLYFNPDVSRFGLVSWTAFDKIVEKGYEHAKEVLSKLTETELNSFRR
jgi:NTE family protein